MVVKNQLNSRIKTSEEGGIKVLPDFHTEFQNCLPQLFNYL